MILWTEELVQVYAPDYGPLRWQAALPAHASVAVGPHGELLVAAPQPTDANCFGLALRELSSDGAVRADRQVATFHCDPQAENDGPPVLSVAFSPQGDALVAGGFNIPVDFGRGTRTPGGQSTFVLDLAP